MHDVLDGHGHPFDDANHAAVGAERFSQEHRQDRIQHFSRNVGERTREREQEGVAREAGEVATQTPSIAGIDAILKR